MARNRKSAVASAPTPDPNGPGANLPVTPARAPTRKEPASWTDADDREFIRLLGEQRARMGDGGSFPMPVFTELAPLLEAMRTKGGPKTPQALKNRYQRIRETHAVIVALLECLGFAWDNKKGANIGIENEGVWEDYVKKHPKAAPFRNKGWDLFDEVDDLLPHRVQGTYMFAPGLAAAGTAAVAGAGGVPPPAADDDDSSDDDALPGTVSTGDTPMPAPAPATANAPTAAPPAAAATVANTAPITAPAAPAAPAPSASAIRARASLNNLPPAPLSSSRAPRESATSLAIGRIESTLGGYLAATRVDTSGAMEPSPKRRKIAIELAQEQEDDDLSDHDMSVLVERFRKDTSAADAYTSLSKPRLRKVWVRRLLDGDE